MNIKIEREVGGDKPVTKAEKIAEHFGVKPEHLSFFPGRGWFYGILERGAVFVGKSFHEIQCSPNWALKRLP
jgi:hypothetical protein